MSRIGYLYKTQDGQIILSDAHITKYDDEDYVLCTNVFLNEYETRCGKTALKKTGKPYVLTSKELDEMQILPIQCSECLFFSEVPFKNGIFQCWCSQNELFANAQYAQFVPNCKLFRNADDEYKLEKLNSEAYSAFLSNFFDNYELKERHVINADKDLPADFGALNGVLTEDEFAHAFGKYQDEKVVIIEDILLFRDFLMMQNAYSVKRSDFDYTFYMYKNTTLSPRFFCFEESKIAILQFYESFYILPFES